MRELRVIRLGLVGLTAALIGGLLIAAQVSAAVTGTLGIGSADLAPGAQGTVSITASVPSPGLGAWTVDVVVQDPSHVSVVSCNAPADSVCNAHYPGSSPTVRFAGATAAGRLGETTLGTVTFRCASSEGSSTLALDTVGFADATVGGPVEIAVTVNPGLIRCRTAAAATSTPSALATPTSPPSRLPTTGTGGPEDSSSLGLMIAALASVGLAGVAGYGVLRRRARHA